MRPKLHQATEARRDLLRPHYKWIVVMMLWFVCFLNYADRQAIFALFPLLRDEFHVSNVQLAFAGSAFMGCYAVFGPVAGWLGDRVSRKKLILTGLAFWLGITVATMMAHRFWEITLLRAFNGLAEAIYFPAAMSLISSYHDTTTRSRAMSLHQSAVYAGTVGGGVAAAWVGERLGWRANFGFLAAGGLILCGVLFFFLREPGLERPGGTTLHQASQNGLLGQLPLSAAVFRLIFAFIGANFVAMAFMVWLPTFLYSTFHMTLAMAGANATLYLQAASVAGVFTGGFVADALAGSDRGGRMRTQALGLFAGVPFLFLAGRAAALAWFITAMLGFGFSKGIYESNLWASLHDVVEPRQRATAVGLMNSLGWLGGSVAPVAIAYGSQHIGMGASLSWTSAVYLAAAILLMRSAKLASRQLAGATDRGL